MVLYCKVIVLLYNVQYFLMLYKKNSLFKDFIMYSLKVYEKTDTFCGQCKMTKRLLDKNNIDYELFSITPDIVELFRNRGLTSAPVVILESDGVEQEVVSGYREDKLKEVIELLSV